jgi:hypothetical protein
VIWRIADFNNDGIPDVLIQSTTAPTATITFGSVPYGTFSGATKGVTFPAGCTSLAQGSVLVGDFNGDHFPDLAYFCGNNTSGIMLGNGDGTFGPASAITGIVSSIAALGDFNKDGKLDIVAVGTNGTDDTFPSIIFYAGNGDGTFGNPVITQYATNSVYTAVVVADINGDGYPDVVAANFIPDNTPSIDVFGNNKDGTFGTAGKITSTPNTTVSVSTSAASSILVGNFFGAGMADLIVPGTGSQPGLFVLQNTSTATAYSFADPVTVAAPGLLGAIAGTFTGGPATDLVVANGTSLSVLTNDGTGNFAASYSALTVPSTASLFAVADANADGYSDIYTATVTAGALQVAVNVTTGTATATSQPFALGTGTKVVTATWNGNVNLSGSTATGQQIVVGAATAVGLTTSKNPSVTGDSVTFTAVVAPTVASDNIPTGTIILTDGATMLASGAIDGTGTFSYTTTALTQATHTITATYSGDNFFATSASTPLSQVVNSSLVVSSFTPTSVTQGASDTKITLTGAGFTATSVVQVNGTAIATTLVSATSLTAIIPAVDFTQIGTLAITVFDTSTLSSSPPVSLTVTAPPVAATVTGPSTTPPGSQPDVTVALTAPYPVDLVGTLTIAFERSGTPQITDPALRFATSGTTSISFPIPAGTTTIPPIALQAGTIAGTITVPLTLTAAGTDVTPTNLAPVTIVVPPAIPLISGMTVTRSGSQLTVVVHGYSNTREVMTANFHFNAASGASIATSDLSLPADVIFNTNWYDTDASDAYGSTFTYTQIFNTSDDATSVGSVDMTLVNSVGQSASVSAK